MKKLVLFCLFLTFLSQAQASFYIGSSKVDMTSRLGTQMMGYVDPFQFAKGIHTRLYSRAFVLQENNKTIALVTVDLQGMYSSLKEEILRRLELSHPGVFRHENLFINATHTHSALSGLSYHLMYNLYYGFNQRVFDDYAKHITQSIQNAFNSKQEGRVFFDKGLLKDASMNRSLEPFNQNPESDIISKVDHNFYQLSFFDKKMVPIGVMNWFAVHGTSMGKSSKLISGDNKGVAALLLERHFKRQGLNNFVASFANGPLGDVSPLPNRYFLPNDDSDLEMTLINGRKQFNKSLRLMTERSSELFKGLDFSHIWYDIADKGCSPALGYSNLAGADDGPSGIGGFFEGMVDGNIKHPIGKFITNIIKNKLASPPTSEQKKCHSKKPLIADLSNEYRAALMIPFQTIRIGDILIAAIPSEITTASSHRLTQAIKTEDFENNFKEIIISSPSNMYSGYLATPEEYDLQHYEGASTMYGPRTLDFYIDGFRLLTRNILDNENHQVLSKEQYKNYIQGAKLNRNFMPKLLELFDIFKPKFLQHNSRADIKRFGNMFGKQKKNYSQGELVKRKFFFPHQPKKSFNKESHFIIQRLINNKWQTLYDEKSPETTFQLSHSALRSSIKISWLTDTHTPPGKYRIKVFGKVEENQFEGKSNNFIIKRFE